VHRTLRAVVLPLTLLCAGAVVGLLAAEWISIPLENCLALPAVRAGSGPRTLLGFGVFLVCLWLAMLVLRLLVSTVGRGFVSDISLVAGAGFTAVAAMLILAAETGSMGVLTAVLVAWLGASGAAYALALWMQPCPIKNRPLLLLRVFSRDRKAERFLDEVQARWRLAGPVLEIGGPDLARLNLDLREFVQFLRLRLYDLMQPRCTSAAAFTATLDLGIDCEGRFRLNQVFCFDSSWQVTLERLLALSDAVVLDLRGFDPGRAGTTHEVGRLAALGLFHRVVAVYDERTDWTHFDATVAQFAPAQKLALKVKASDEDALERCVAALLRIADEAAPEALTSPMQLAPRATVGAAQ
jgi:hypothetical protein